MKKLIDNADKHTYTPINLSNLSEKEMSKVLETPGIQVSDNFEELVKELFYLKNPTYRFKNDVSKEEKEFIEIYCRGLSFDELGNWFYFPWINKIVHFLEENDHLFLRTARNRYLISENEQNKYYNSSILICGLSVGSHAALTLAMTGGPKKMLLADPDVISGSNLNRIRTGFQNIGVKKTIFVARQIYEANPYCEIILLSDGLNNDNIKNLFDKRKYSFDLVLEEMDQPYFKFKVREMAKENKIPVLMATDNGDNIFIDIERFDRDPNLEIFNGLAKDLTSNKLKELSPMQLPAVAASIAGAEQATERMQFSVLEVGKTIYSWPQLGTAANMSGSVLSYLARKVILNVNNLESGRYQVNIDEIFENDYYEPNIVNNRKISTDNFLKTISKFHER
jgi:molybdopterin/thiamine biosynthesis adenylyltransferase